MTPPETLHICRKGLRIQRQLRAGRGSCCRVWRRRPCDHEVFTGETVSMDTELRHTSESLMERIVQLKDCL